MNHAIEFPGPDRDGVKAIPLRVQISILDRHTR